MNGYEKFKTNPVPTRKRSRTYKEGISSSLARILFSQPEIMDNEKKYIKNQIKSAGNKWESLQKAKNKKEEKETAEIDNEIRSLEDNIDTIIQTLKDRYLNRRNICTVLHGGIASDDQADRRHAFNAPGAPLVIIASSVGQTGIDLQAYCEHVIHYDLEWNAAKMEQREGRVDRLGRQGKGKIKVYYLLCKGNYDERMFLQCQKRQQWQRLIIGTNKHLTKDEETPNAPELRGLTPKMFRRLTLDLRPKNV